MKRSLTREEIFNNRNMIPCPGLLGFIEPGSKRLTALTFGDKNLSVFCLVTVSWGLSFLQWSHLSVPRFAGIHQTDSLGWVIGLGGTLKWVSGMTVNFKVRASWIEAKRFSSNLFSFPLREVRRGTESSGVSDMMKMKIFGFYYLVKVRYERIDVKDERGTQNNFEYSVGLELLLLSTCNQPRC